METKEILDYFKNIEITNIQDPLIIKNIFTEIKPAIEQIILHNTLSIKLENFLNDDLKKELLFTIDFDIIYKKLGSRVIEKIINEIEFDEKTKNYLLDKLNTNFMKYFLDQNATFIIRILVKKLNYQVDADLIITNLRSILKNDYSLITLQEILPDINNKQKIIAKILFPIEDLKTKRSYFYQKIIDFSDKTNLKNIYNMVKNDILELANDKYGNYVVQELIKKDSKNIKTYYEIVKANTLPRNIVYNMIMKLLTKKEEKRACKLIKKHFQAEPDIFKSILFYDDSLNYKYVKIIEKLFFVKEKYSFDVKKLFFKYFKDDWLDNSNGFFLIKAFFEGNANKKEKSTFYKKIKSKLEKHKKGAELIKIINKNIK